MMNEVNFSFPSLFYGVVCGAVALFVAYPRFVRFMCLCLSMLKNQYQHGWNACVYSTFELFDFIFFCMHPVRSVAGTEFFPGFFFVWTHRIFVPCKMCWIGWVFSFFICVNWLSQLRHSNGKKTSTRKSTANCSIQLPSFQVNEKRNEKVSAIFSWIFLSN